MILPSFISFSFIASKRERNVSKEKRLDIVAWAKSPTEFWIASHSLAMTFRVLSLQRENRTGVFNYITFTPVAIHNNKAAEQMFRRLINSLFDLSNYIINPPATSIA